MSLPVFFRRRRYWLWNACLCNLRNNKCPADRPMAKQQIVSIDVAWPSYFIMRNLLPLSLVKNRAFLMFAYAAAYDFIGFLFIQPIQSVSQDDACGKFLRRQRRIQFWHQSFHDSGQRHCFHLHFESPFQSFLLCCD